MTEQRTWHWRNIRDAEVVAQRLRRIVPHFGTRPLAREDLDAIMRAARLVWGTSSRIQEGLTRHLPIFVHHVDADAPRPRGLRFLPMSELYIHADVPREDETGAPSAALAFCVLRESAELIEGPKSSGERIISSVWRKSRRLRQRGESPRHVELIGRMIVDSSLIADQILAVEAAAMYGVVLPLAGSITRGAGVPDAAVEAAVSLVSGPRIVRVGARSALQVADRIYLVTDAVEDEVET